MYLDNQFLGSFQEHFVSRLKGGVFVINKQNAVALFKNFNLVPCDNFNEEGQCTDLKDGKSVAIKMIEYSVSKSIKAMKSR